MTERHAFLSAIRESPDDDTPRLVYADWLEEHGEPERAELVRVGCELATEPNEGCDWGIGLPCGKCRFCFLRRRERALLGELLHAFGPKEPAPNRVKRGIIELAICTWSWWREHGDTIWERELPWRVRLTTEPTLTKGGDIEFVGKTTRTFRYRIAGRIAAVRQYVVRHPSADFPGWKAHILACRWPGIDFELPGVTAADVEAVIAERANA